MAPLNRWRVLSRYVCGKTTKADQDAITSWVENDPDVYALLDQVQMLYEAAGEDDTTEFDVQEAWQEVSSQLEKREGSRAPSRRADRPPKRMGRSPKEPISESGRVFFRRRRLVLTAVAVLLVAIGVSIVFYAEGTDQIGSSDAHYGEVATERGERASITLPDGSQVVLNVDSKIFISTDYSEGPREVYVEGEAFFEVRADDQRPFIVETNDASIRVLGTSFNVQSYPESDETTVLVAEGEVDVRWSVLDAGNPSFSLRAGQVGRLLRSSGSISQEPADVDKYLGWKEGRLVFDDNEMDDVANRLSRWFDVDVEVEPEIRGKRLSADLRSTSIEDVLRVISATLEISHTIEEDRVVFSEST